MAGIFVYAEHREGRLKKATLEALAAARSLAGPDPVVAVVVGDGVGAQADLAGSHGADRVIVGEDSRLGLYSPTATPAWVAAILESEGASAFLCAATAQGKDLSARVAALLDSGLATDCIGVSRDGTSLLCRRPVMAGKAIATVRVDGGVPMATIRPNTFSPLDADASRVTEVVSASSGVDDDQFGARVTAVHGGEGKSLDVAEADIIVTAGRGMKGPEHWPVIEDLAEALGAATGASRAVVDAGWAPHEKQVGQTGKTVSPALYVACGVSGAIQHLAGMRSSKCIVAINKDPDAPIFKVADYGVVGDLFEVVPALSEAVRGLQQD